METGRPCPRYLLLVSCIAVVTATQAQPYTLLSGWPQADGIIRAMVLDEGSNTLYVGGEFTTLGGQPRDRLAAIDVTTGALNAWNPGANGTVHAMVLAGSTVYVGGEFTMLGGTGHDRLGAVDASTGAVSSWSPSLNNSVLTILPGLTTVYVGGTFTSANGVTRNRAAAFEALTGLLLPWNPNANSQVRTLAWKGLNIAIGGGFTFLGLTPRGRVAEVDAVLGLPTLWNPNVDNVVSSLAVDGSAVYVGGIFTSVGGQPRGALAAIDATSGGVLAWAPTAAGVQHVSVQGGAVMAGGFFSTVNGSPQGNMAVLDPVTGALDPGSPATSSTVYAIIRSSTHLFVGGAFTIVNGSQPRGRFAAFSTCSMLSWFEDSDGDGLGDPAVMLNACAQPVGYVGNNSDCDDGDPFIGAPMTWYADADGDNFGDPGVTQVSCEQPVGYVPNAGDCDDADGSIFPGASCDDGNSRSYEDIIDGDCTCHGRPARMEITVYLEGAFDGTGMHTDLMEAGLIPLQEPYSELGYTFVNGGGGETTLPEELDYANDDYDAVDWVVVELRSSVSPFQVVESHACLLRRNGIITTALNGNLAEFPNSDGETYQVAIRHRNHLPVMTFIAEGVTLGAIDAVVSLQDPTTGTYGTTATKNMDGTMVMWMGNTDFSNSLLYVGEGNDRDPILARIGGSVPTNSTPGYFLEDTNLDGVVRYVGSDNDRDPILSNIGGAVPTNTRMEQLPPP